MEADVAIVTRTFRAMETDKVKITRGTMLFRLYRPCAMVCLMAQITAANVVLMGTNLTLSFDDVEATFAPGVKGSGVNGIVYTAEPLNACSALTNKTVKGPPSTFALIIRGGCTFDEKVKNAQDAGFEAAIVYDNENSGDLDSKFHAACVDMWLTSWRSFCPVCKGDVGAGISGPSASETTPLFSSAVGLPSTSSSFRSSAGASPPRPISRRPSSQSISRIYSVSGTPHSYRSIHGSIADLANMFSPCLGTLHLGSTHTGRQPLVSTRQHKLRTTANVLPFRLRVTQSASQLVLYLQFRGRIFFRQQLPGFFQPAPVIVPMVLWGVGP